ncbi:His/Gly/Thr/Pro-type tRNA ligase C-terminal domain-containing protein, partial [Patescibacteria group bacterium]|nr:His/Gly/Thr/Pro-type tRNA ligase C-terminal domain-containing protein [Patescibacteria group bacterium]
DIEYNSPFGWAEFMGIHNRGDWDLRRHQEFSGQDFRYRDPETNEEYLPWDIETSAGVDRSLLFFLIDAYTEEENRIVLKIHPRLAPYQAAVFPLLPNKEELTRKAREIYLSLKDEFMVAWDDRGNIGKRYFSQDEIGTPFCLTVDFESLAKGDLTIRDRDSLKQERIKIDEVKNYLRSALALS